MFIKTSILLVILALFGGSFVVNSFLLTNDSKTKKNKPATISKKYLNYKKYNEVKKHDNHFRKYSKRYFGVEFDYRIFKAQAIAESRLKEKAVSRAGALGIMQIMPRTYTDIKKKNKLISGAISDTRWSIAAGIYYNRYLWNDWRAERSFQDRINFMIGSYNAGKKNILKAQKHARWRGKNGNNWKEIEKTLHKVTRGHSRETIAYVRKIEAVTQILD